MKILVLFICVAVCCGENVGSSKNYENDYYEEHVGNPDDFADIERPCQVYDLFCIRKFFAEHAKCTIANPNNKIPDPVLRSQVSQYGIIANLTAISTNNQIRGLNSTRVEEFYINKKTDKVVFAINVRRLTQSTPASYFAFYRNGREPIVQLFEGSLVYPSITFTLVIPNIKDMQLDKAEVTGFVDGFAIITLVPRAPLDPDPAVAAGLAKIVSSPFSITQAAAFSDIIFYAAIYIQNNICDFGLKLL